MKFEDQIVQALKLIDIPTNIIVVKSDRDGVVPAVPYVIINIIDTWNIGTPRKTVNKNSQGLYQVKDVHVSLTFQMSATDTNQDWVQRFSVGLGADMFDWAFTQQGLGIVSYDDVKYQPDVVSGKAYKRANIDITFRTEVYEEFRVNQVKRINVEGYLSSKTPNFETDIDFTED